MECSTAILKMPPVVAAAAETRFSCASIVLANGNGRTHPPLPIWGSHGVEFCSSQAKVHWHTGSCFTTKFVHALSARCRPST